MEATPATSGNDALMVGCDRLEIRSRYLANVDACALPAIADLLRAMLRRFCCCWASSSSSCCGGCDMAALHAWVVAQHGRRLSRLPGGVLGLRWCDCSQHPCMVAWGLHPGHLGYPSITHFRLDDLTLNVWEWADCCTVRRLLQGQAGLASRVFTEERWVDRVALACGALTTVASQGPDAPQ